MKQLHIFSYGQDQVINNTISKSFDKNTLTYHEPLVTLLGLDNGYINIYMNDEFDTYTVNLGNDVMKGEMTEEIITAMNNLIDEILTKS